MSTRRVWSVTTIIGLAMPKPALTPWAANTVADYVIANYDELGPLIRKDPDGARDTMTRARFRKSGEASERGTDVHAYLESVLLGIPPEKVDENVEPYARQVVAFLEEFRPKVIAAEAPVFNMTFGYAGTLDAILELDGLTLVVDLKTTDKPENPKRKGPPYPEVALQLAAYAHAEYVAVRGSVRETELNGRRYYQWRDDDPHEPMPAIDGAAALIVRPDSYRFHPVKVDDEVFRTFLLAREMARWQVETSRTVIGPTAAPEELLAAAP